LDVVLSLLCFFFFFQAEDGIRDDLVTGVQTCALPISCAADPHNALWPARQSARPGHNEEHTDQACGVFDQRAHADEERAPEPSRSEERRVGKECRTRRSTD